MDFFLLCTSTFHLSRHGRGRGGLGSFSQKQAALSKYQKLPRNSSIYVKCPEEVNLWRSIGTENRIAAARDRAGKAGGRGE